MSHKECLKSIGTELRVARTRKGYKQSDIAEKTGFKVMCISDLELGKRDSAILTYKRIADVLGLAMKDFL